MTGVFGTSGKGGVTSGESLSQCALPTPGPVAIAGRHEVGRRCEQASEDSSGSRAWPFEIRHGVQCGERSCSRPRCWPSVSCRFRCRSFPRSARALSFRPRPGQRWTCSAARSGVHTARSRRGGSKADGPITHRTSSRRVQASPYRPLWPDPARHTIPMPCYVGISVAT